MPQELHLDGDVGHFEHLQISLKNSALSGYSGAMLKLHGHCQVAGYCTR